MFFGGKFPEIGGAWKSSNIALKKRLTLLEN
jgi:hypothetical protein